MATWPTTPKDWTPFEVVTAAQLDANIRDPLQLALNALVTTQGDMGYATAANTLQRLGIGNTGDILQVAGGIPAWDDLEAALGLQSDVVDTNEVTASDSYTNLTTPGPEIDLTIRAGGKALIGVGAGRMYNNTAGSFAIMGVDIDGGGVDSKTEILRAPGANNAVAAGWRWAVITGLTPGTVTFTAKYKRATSGNAGFGERSLIGMAL